MRTPVSLEICAGGGGQALGLEQAGFSHAGLVEIDEDACRTLRANRPLWNVIHEDVTDFDGHAYQGIDLLAGGVPCPPFSVAGKQLGRRDERNLFPEVLRLTRELRPSVVMVENVRGLLAARFEDYRAEITTAFHYLGYTSRWQLLNASDYGVPQLRPRTLMVAVRHHKSELFEWPTPNPVAAMTVGEVLSDLMGSSGWRGVDQWQSRAAGIAPTIVGGSHKHGGPDLGPVRARRAWARLGVNGLGIADAPPTRDFSGDPKLTIDMVAKLQGFPDDWRFVGNKTRAYRQVGNAFPPPVARAVGTQLLDCLGIKQLSLMEV